MSDPVFIAILLFCAAMCVVLLYMAIRDDL